MRLCVCVCVSCVGYSLNALVDFPADNPIEIIKHLMIGSEGTLGFVSQVGAETHTHTHTHTHTTQSAARMKRVAHMLDAPCPHTEPP